jgi:hypothetical protein
MNRRKFLGRAACTSVLSALPLPALAQSESESAPAASDVQTIWDKPEFEVRGVEIHSRRMWEWRSVMSAFALMEKMNMNMLIFHQDNIQDTVVWPEKYVPKDAQSYKKIVQGLHEQSVYLLTARDYLRDVALEAKKRNIKFFFEVTEIGYGDGLEQLYPEILGEKGTICPTAPFWWDFLREKYTELFEVLPDLSGVVVSAGTFESKLSITMGTCNCPSCSTTTPAEWYSKLIGSIYEPFQRAGKTLVVRDFSYTKANQNVMMNAVQSVSSDIVAALKTTPHDFYLTFPDNPRIGHEGNNPQWIEFDTWGQFYGCGLFPCGVAEDMQRRLTYDRAHGAVGAWFRTDLESMTDESVFNSFNLLNLISGAMLSQNVNQNIDNVYKAWLETGLLDVLIPESLEPAPVPIPQAYLGRLKDFMQACYSIAVKTYYVRGFLFYQNGRFFNSVDNALFLMTVHAGLEDWEPGANKRVDPTDENIAAIIAEKDEALAEVQKLPGILQAESLPVSDEFKEHIATMLSLFHEYVVGFKLCAIGIFRAKQAELSKQADHAQQGLKAADDLQEYRNKIPQLLGDKFYPQDVHRAFDVYTLDKLVKSIRDICLPLAKA